MNDAEKFFRLNLLGKRLAALNWRLQSEQHTFIVCSPVSEKFAISVSFSLETVDMVEGFVVALEYSQGEKA